jgi:outer membrane protein OmpA-like peptidoglycan-associated protein
MNSQTPWYFNKRALTGAAGCLFIVSVDQSIASAYQYPSLNSNYNSRIFIAPTAAKSSAALRAIPATGSKLMIKKDAPIAEGVITISPSGPTALTYDQTFTLPAYSLISVGLYDTNSNPVASEPHSGTAETNLLRGVVCARISSTTAPETAITTGPLTPGEYLVQCTGPSTISVLDEVAGESYSYTVEYPILHLTVTKSDQPALVFAGASGPALTALPIVAPTGGAGTGAVTYAISPSNTDCILTNDPAVNTTSNITTTCVIVATKAADINYNARSSEPTNFGFTAIAPTPQPVTHAVTYSAGLGAGTLPTQSAVAEGSSFTVASGSTLNRDGYAFIGWNDGTKDYAAGSLYSVTSSSTSPIHLTALWSLNTYTITFNNQGHGTTPALITGATSIIAANLPSESNIPASESAVGYSFHGWSLTSSGVALTADTPITQDTTLFALWQTEPKLKPPVIPDPPVIIDPPVITPPTGSVIAQPIVLPRRPIILRAPRQRFTPRALQSAGIATIAKFADITFNSKEIALTHDAGTDLKLTPGVLSSLNNRLNVVLTKTGAVFTALKGWTGRISVPVVGTANGKLTEMFVGVEEDPAPVLKPFFVLESTQTAKLSWGATSSQVLFYNVYLGSKLVCSTNQTTCYLPISSIADFKANLTIEAVGHQGTYSTRMLPAYTPTSLVSAGLVHFKNASAVLSAAEKTNLNQLVTQIEKLGATKVAINGHADSTAGTDNKALSVARANAVKAYLLSKLPGLKVTVKGFSATVPAGSNATAAGRSDNRRAEILVG